LVGVRLVGGMRFFGLLFFCLLGLLEVKSYASSARRPI
jgi:hypothetical protein